MSISTIIAVIIFVIIIIFMITTNINDISSAKEVFDLIKLV